MTTNEIRQKYLEFFKKRGHKIIPPAPLVLQNDPTTLFTSSGMQPLVPYLMGEPHPEGKRVVDSQPSIRVQDIEEVGDNRHTTFFEMLGNWSFGDYFKKEQLTWIWEFLTEELELPKEKLYVSIFEGNESVPRDEESYEIWRSIGVPEDHVFEYGVKKNWWSRSGIPENMPPGEIGGPDSEIFFEFDSVEHDSKFGEKCHPNCDCGRFLEIGNSVFIQYKKNEDGTLSELPQKNVDFGGGLERIAAAVNNDPDIFKIDIFKEMVELLENNSKKSYSTNSHGMRVIVDHIRATVFLASSGVIPSNKQQGYIMRRLLRRAVVKAKKLGIEPTETFRLLVEIVIDNYANINTNADYFDKGKGIYDIYGQAIDIELLKFEQTLDKGLREVEKVETIDGKIAFDLYQTYGFPLELTIELFAEKGQSINEDEFKAEFAKHQDLSRTQSAGVFKGGLADHSEETTRLHTATHLLHKALREVLGEHVQQKGSNITAERLRFDFVHTEKLTDEQKKQIEDLVNAQIDKDLPVSSATMSLEQAKDEGALAFFGEKYADLVKVYTVGDPKGEWFSKEVCGGPHVTHLKELQGHVTITKEESVGGGVRRIYAVISA